MSSAFLMVLFTWVSSIVVAAHVNWKAAAVITGGMAVFALARNMQPTTTFSVIAFGIVATIYGQAQQTVTPICELPASVEATIQDIHTVRSESVQYRVKAGDCSVLLTAPRWPQYRVDNVVTIAGGSQQTVTDLAREIPGYAAYLTRRGYTHTWRWADIELSESATGQQEWRQLLVQRVHQLWPEPDASIITAMVLAERGTIPDEITDTFRVTGTSHVLAISGLHVSLIAVLILVLASLIPAPRWLRVLIVAGLLWLYVTGIGAPISSVRAALFWTLVAVGYQLRWLIALPTILLGAVALLVTSNPHIIFEVGFQLSGAAVVGIFTALFLLQSTLLRLSSPARWLATTVVVSAGAAITTAPLIAYHFGMISFISVLANALVVPVVPFIIAGSLLTVAASYIWWLLARAFAWGVHIGIEWMLTAASFMSGLPGASIAEVEFAGSWVALYYLALFASAILVGRFQNRSWRELLVP